MKQSKMTKEELEKKWLGKRVAVYDANKFRKVGEVVGVTTEAGLKIILQGNENMYDVFHPKQCRILKKRERRYERELHKIRLQLKFGIEALQYLGFTADVFKREMVEMYSSGVSNHIFELDKALELAFEALKKMRGRDE